MKIKLIFGLLMAAIISIACFAKSKASADIDTLYINHFDLCVTGTRASSKNTILLNESELLKKFGAPQRISTEYAEMAETNMTHYRFKGADIWYLNGLLERISLTNASFNFQIRNGRSIKVGDNISAVSKMFPGSWANRHFEGQVFVALQDHSGPVDTTLLFQYDPATNLVTEISVQD